MSLNHQKKRQEYEREDMYERQHDAYAHAKYEVLLDWLKTSTNTPQKILNVGCGSGELCILLAQLGHIVTGIDPVEEYISIARSQAKQKGLFNCTFKVSSLEDIHDNLSQSKYDVVFSTDVVEHIRDDARALEQLAELVNPGGDLFITVPGGQYLFGFHDEQLGHYRRYSLRRLASLLPINLRIVKLRYFGFSLIPVAWLYSQILRRYYPVSETGARDSKYLFSRIVKLILALEKGIYPPLGTSCLLWARKDK